MLAASADSVRGPPYWGTYSAFRKPWLYPRKKEKKEYMVFCYQNCSDLLWEKIVLVMKKNFWNSRLKADNLKVQTMFHKKSSPQDVIRRTLDTQKNCNDEAWDSNAKESSSFANNLGFVSSVISFIVKHFPISSDRYVNYDHEYWYFFSKIVLTHYEKKMF